VTAKKHLGLTWMEWFMLGIAAVALTAEIVAFVQDPSLTISDTIRRDSRRWLWEAYLFGLLPGHFFAPAINWRRFGWQDRPWIFPVLWILTAAAVVARDVFVGGQVSQWWTLWVALGAFAEGAILWNQGD
jgi:hypothetical protein